MLLDSYDRERCQAADEDIGYSTRATNFVSSREAADVRLRDAVLSLCSRAEFARRMVNTGRLSTPTVHDSPLSTPDEATFAGDAHLGAPAPDAPIRTRGGRDGFLLEQLGGAFDLLYVRDGAAPRTRDGIRLHVIGDDVIDSGGLFAQRFDATPGAAYLLRPDQHLCARWRRFDPAKVEAARDRALGRHPHR